MLEEKIFQVLKSKITDGGKKVTSISDRTIMAEAKRCGKQITEESQIEAGIVESLESLTEYEGNLSAVAAEVARKASTPPPATPPVPPVPPAPPVTEEPAWAKAIREKMEAQEAKEANAQKSAAQKAKLAEAAALLKAKGAVHEKTLNTTLALHQFDDNLTAEQIAEKALPLYNTEYKEFFGDAPAPKSAAPLSDEAKKSQQEAAQRALAKTREKLGLKAPVVATT